jgi:dipeptidyl aminopeptidase/acylaminoacyl peptidase
LHINADRIGVWGESAGGTLAALAGLTGGRVSAVVGWYPLTDMLTAHADRDGSPEARLLGVRPSADPGRAAQASPITHVSAVAPPFLLMHGLADRTLPISHSERLHSLLIAAGARSTYRPITGADHCFENHHDIPGLIDESVTFLAKELGA